MPLIVAVRASCWGWIALLDDGRLVAAHADGRCSRTPSDAPDAILRALERAAGAPRAIRDEESDEAVRSLSEWMARDWAQRSSGLGAVDTPMRRRVRRAIVDELRRAPRHRRAEILRCAAMLRQSLSEPLRLGVERALDALAAERAARTDWIAEAAAVATRTRAARALEADRAPPGYRALILFGSDGGQ